MSTTTTTARAACGRPGSRGAKGLGGRFNLNTLLVEGRALIALVIIIAIFAI